jgi:FAD/FMN-containing dehydrogenase
LSSGNLHINICADKYDDEIEKVIEPYVYEIVAEERGSISAEHGLGKSFYSATISNMLMRSSAGVMKAPYIGYSKSQTSIDMMKQVKKMFDPKGILNPYKYVVV